jgi:predicted ATPase
MAGSAWNAMNGLLGREPELAGISELIERLDALSGSALVLRGAAGIGKTALLEATAASARGKQARVLSVTGVPAETRMPFASLRQLLSPVLREPSAVSGLLHFGLGDPVFSALRKTRWAGRRSQTGSR